ncbi:MAG: hypothetical protein AAB154_05380, partial [Candidatus Binatota bacterium]
HFTRSLSIEQKDRQSGCPVSGDPRMIYLTNQDFSQLLTPKHLLTALGDGQPGRGLLWLVQLQPRNLLKMRVNGKNFGIMFHRERGDNEVYCRQSCTFPAQAC